MFRYNGEVGSNFEKLYRAIKSFANCKKEEFKRYEVLSDISRSELFTLFLGQFCFGLNTVVRLLRDEANSVPQKWGLARGDLAELSCTDHRPLAEESALFKSYFAKLDKIYFYALDQEIFGVFAATNKTILLEETEEYSVSSTTGFLCMYDAKSLVEEFFPQRENRDISLALRLLYYHLDFRRE